MSDDNSKTKHIEIEGIKADGSRPAPAGTNLYFDGRTSPKHAPIIAPPRPTSGGLLNIGRPPASPPPPTPPVPKPAVTAPRPPNMSSMTFPAAFQKQKSEEKPDPSSGAVIAPDEAILKRIRESKDALKLSNRDLDQTLGAGRARQSASYYASRGIETMSDRTAAQYNSKARLLVNRYQKELGLSIDTEDLNATEFVLWLLSIKPTVKSSTWRVYRSAVYHFLEGLPLLASDMDQALKVLDNDITENDARAGARENWENDEILAKQRGSHKTSAMKSKKFAKKDFDKVINYLKVVSKSKMSVYLIDWLIASVHTGLRPTEWKATSVQRFVDSKGRAWVWLYVLNAKATNSRGNGVVRTLDITDLPTNVLSAVERMSKHGLEWYEEGRFETIKSQVGQLLYNIGEKLFPNRVQYYALYSCRHQFIANMKSVLEPEQVSALSGHSITKTAVTSYGKKSSHWEPSDFLPHAKPIEEEVATVRKTASFYEDRMKKLVDLGLIHGNTDISFDV